MSAQTIDLETHSVSLDSIEPLEARVGFGQLGRRGDLGYEGKRVTVNGTFYPHALSTHPPSRLTFDLGGRFSTFRSAVAINGDVQEGQSHAQFSVIADGRSVAVVPLVNAGEPPREIVCDIRGVHRLELAVSTTRWECCHAVWLKPQLDVEPIYQKQGTILDCLQRTEITLPSTALKAERCVATVASAGFSGLLDDMLGSLVANARCPDALIVVFLTGSDAASEQVARKYQAALVRCRPRARVNATLKSLMYSLPLVVDAKQFLCLDADMLVLDDLRPVFAALDACMPGSILACREGNGYYYKDLGNALRTIYCGHDQEILRILFSNEGELDYPLVVNDGIFAGGREALLALDSLVRSMPHAITWTDARRDIPYRNQFIFNLALARLACGVELDPLYNVQLNSQEAELEFNNGRVKAAWNVRPARVLHFNGGGRHKYPKWRNLFARVPDPLVGPVSPDSYETFRMALRAWIGRHGLKSLAWSFYGTGDAESAYVSDVVTFPLLALLHYLIRSNGAVRVLETGTGFGVSTACIASAIAHRESPKIVTFDPTSHSEAEELWSTLPSHMAACIERRSGDSLEGMALAQERGESFHAALLDSLHTEAQVWAEFQLATKLVCSGGIILVHDVLLKTGTVEQGLKCIEAAGYGVTRLWTAEQGAKEGAPLGLAVIENRRVSSRREKS